MKQKQMLGAVLLIAGSCIGAGMLALPIKTSISGFFPFLVSFVVTWLFMLSTGLLLLEVNHFFGEYKNINIVTMAQMTLGKYAKISVWILFCFLFFCLV